MGYFYNFKKGELIETPEREGKGTLGALSISRESFSCYQKGENVKKGGRPVYEERKKREEEKHRYRKRDRRQRIRGGAQGDPVSMRRKVEKSRRPVAKKGSAPAVMATHREGGSKPETQKSFHPGRSQKKKQIAWSLRERRVLGERRAASTWKLIGHRGEGVVRSEYKKEARSKYSRPCGSRFDEIAGGQAGVISDPKRKLAYPVGRERRGGTKNHGRGSR